MKKLLSIPAYLWAVACLLLIPVTFVKNDTFAEQLAKLPFMKVHPVYNGGEINREYSKDDIDITVNKPVGTTLFNNPHKRVVQVIFSASGKLPEMIDQTIDYNFDNTPDFKVRINTQNGQTDLMPLDQYVKSLRASSAVKETWVIRVNIEEAK